MAVDKNKVIAEATKFAQRGQWDKAIRAYDKILAEDPKDVRVLLKVGELHQKRGDQAAAAATFARVAEAYTDQGFFLKAIAVYKQMVKLAPEDVRVNERLANLYQQLGIMSDAMAQLQLVAQAAERGGDAGRLVEVLRRMTDIEPENPGSAVKLGEIYARQGNAAAALEEFRRAAEVLKRNGRGDEWLRVAERIAVLSPDDLQLTRELAHAYLAKGDTKRALSKLQLCFKAEPKDVGTLTLLARAFGDLGQTSKTVSVYKELAHVHAEQGRVEEARATWRRVAELAPEDPDAQAALRPAPAGRAPAAGPPPPPPRPAAPPRPPAAPAVPAAPAAAGGRAPGPEAIPKLLTETDVYLKYGLHQKALEHLRKVFEIDPDHLEARERARDIRAAAGDADGAADEAVRAARTAERRGLRDRVAAAAAWLRQHAPRHPELPALEAAAGLAPAAALGEEVLLEPGFEVEPLPEISIEAAPAEVAGADDDVALAAAGEGDDDRVAEEEPAAAAAGLAEDEGPAVDDEPLGPPPPARPAAIPLGPPTPVARIVPVPAPRATLPPVPAPPELRPGPPPLPAPPEVRPPPPAPPEPAPPPPSAAPPDLADELGEAEFLLQQGLLDEASETLRGLLASHPGLPGAVALLAEVERRAQAAEPAGAEPAPAGPAAGDGFDIGKELAAELGAGSPPPPPDELQFTVEEVFSQFKKGVAQTVKAEDTDTHYDLGIAYKEMGLLDDALQEFETALRGATRRREIDCLSMIALCRMEKGDPAAAVQAWRRALRSDWLTPEAARAVHYELAAAYRAAGDAEAALWYLNKVVRGDRGFRDAAAQLDALGGGAGRPPPDGEGPPPAPAAPEARGGPNKNVGYV